jgi:hypothetical protein
MIVLFGQRIKHGKMMIGQRGMDRGDGMDSVCDREKRKMMDRFGLQKKMSNFRSSNGA